MSKLVTLTTDFGTRDYHAAGVKGAILRECPDARIVDVTHDLEPFNVRGASLILWQAAPCFPEGTVHAAVVFPETGVGRVVAVRAGGHYLVGPDNGLLYMAAESLGVEEVRAVEAFSGNPGRARTFDGRFLVAPAAGRLAAGAPIGELGPALREMRRLTVRVAKVSSDSVQGEVIHVDRFGNLVTNVPADGLPDWCGEDLCLRALGREWTVRMAECFAEGGRGGSSW